MTFQKIPRHSDTDIGRALAKVQERWNGGAPLEVSVHAVGQHIGTVRFPNPEAETWTAIMAMDGSAIEHFNCGVLNGGVRVSYHRGGNNAQRLAHFDEIEVTAGDGGTERVRAAAGVLAEFRPVAIELPSTSDDERLLAVRSQQEATFERLERLHEDSIRSVNKQREHLDLEFERKVTALEEAFAERRAAFDQEISGVRDELAQAKAALDEREAVLDNKDNTHARRDNRTRLLNDVKGRIEKFGVSPSTAAKRRPVMLGMVALIALLIAGMVSTTVELLALQANRANSIVSYGAAARVEVAAAANAAASRPVTLNAIPAATLATFISEDTTARWVLWGRGALLSLGLGAVLLYYIRWQNQWAEQHSHAEFALQQFYLDVNRANWVVESCLEWRKETESPIPSALLDSITRGLFSPSDGAPEKAQHPADELASAILGTASKLKLKAGDTELEFDKPGKALKAAEKAKD